MRFRNVGLVEGGKLKTQVTELEGKCQKPFAKEKTHAQHAKKKKTNTLQLCYSAIVSFHQIRSRERAKYATVIH